MDKIIITITKWRVTGYHLGDNIVETGKVKLTTYTEKLSLMNVDSREIPERKAKFIEKIAQQVVGINRQQEREFKRKGLGSFVRLIISNVQHK